MIGNMKRFDAIDPYEPPYSGTTTAHSNVYISSTDVGPMFTEREVTREIKKQSDSRRRHRDEIPKSSFAKAKKRARNRIR